MKRILSVITAAAALLSLAACVKAPEETGNTRPKETKEAVTYEPYKGVSGDYSGAKFEKYQSLPQLRRRADRFLRQAESKSA